MAARLMAIPIRTAITCPACGTSEDVTLGDTSVGPAGRVSDAPIYVMLANPLWSQTDRDGESYLSCTTCGEAEFATVAQIAQNPMRGKPTPEPQP